MDPAQVHGYVAIDSFPSLPYAYSRPHALLIAKLYSLASSSILG